MGSNGERTYCLRDRPVSFGEFFLVPKNSLVVMIRSLRRRPSSLMTRPLQAGESKAHQGHFILRNRIGTHNSRSDSPFEYASAVSNMLMPFS